MQPSPHTRHCMPIKNKVISKVFASVCMVLSTEVPKPPPQATGDGGQQQPQTGGTLVGPTKRGPNECNSSPCINGVCVDTPDGFVCQCLKGYRLVDSVTCEGRYPGSIIVFLFGVLPNKQVQIYSVDSSILDLLRSSSASSYVLSPPRFSIDVALFSLCPLPLSFLQLLSC